MDKNFAMEVLSKLEANGSDMDAIGSELKDLNEEEQTQFFEMAAGKLGMSYGQEEQSKPTEEPNEYLQGVESFSHGALSGLTAGHGKEPLADIMSVGADVGKLVGAIDTDQSKVDIAKSLGENIIRANPIFQIPIRALSSLFTMDRKDNETFRQITESIDENESAAKHGSPLLNTVGEIAGYAMPQGVFMKGLGFVSKGLKGAQSINKMARVLGGGKGAVRISKIINNAVEIGAASGVYSAVENLPDVADSKSIEEAKDNAIKAAEEIGIDTAFGSMFAGITNIGLRVSRGTARFIAKNIPEHISKYAGKLTQDTVDAYKKYRGEINKYIGSGGDITRNAGKDFSNRNNVKIKSFIDKNNEIISGGISGQHVSNRGLVKVVKESLDDVGTIIVPEFNSVVKNLKFTLKKIESREYISGKDLNKMKRQVADIINFDFNGLGAKPEISKRYMGLWIAMKNLENRIGGSAVIKANNRLHTLMEHQQTLKYHRITAEPSSGDAIANTSGGLDRDMLFKYGKDVARKPQEKDVLKEALEQIDKMVGTTLRPDAAKLNAIFELTRDISPKILVPLSIGYGAGYYSTGDYYGGIGGMAALLTLSNIASLSASRRFFITSGNSLDKLIMSLSPTTIGPRIAPKVAEQTGLKDMVKQKAGGYIGK